MKLKVVHLLAPTTLAGAERVLLNYVASHDTVRIDLIVATYVNIGRQRNSFTDELERLDIPFRRITIVPHKQVEVLRETVKLLREEGADLVHSHGYRSDIVGYLAARAAGVRIVSTVHGWTGSSWKLRLYEKMDRWLLKRFDGVIGVSSALVDDLLRSGLGRNKVRLIHNAVIAKGGESASPADSPVPRVSGERVILTVARLSYEKGVDLLLHAFCRYCFDMPEVRLLIVGDGPLRGELECLAAQLCINEKVTFAGYSIEVDRYYASADLFVLPSRTEGLPMVLLEALQAGVPVVSTDVGGIPEVIENGVNGFTVQPENIEALGSAIRTALDDHARSLKIGEAGRITVKERFSSDVWAKVIERFYSDTVAGRARPDR